MTGDINTSYPVQSKGHGEKCGEESSINLSEIKLNFHTSEFSDAMLTSRSNYGDISQTQPPSEKKRKLISW